MIKEINYPEENWLDDVLLDTTWYQWNHANGINGIGFYRHLELYHDIVQWIKLMKFSEDNVKWMKMNDCIYVRFKNELEYLAFILKFGPAT